MVASPDREVSMVAQQYQFQIQATGKKVELKDLENRTNAKRNALAKRDENKRTGQKPRELRLPPQLEPRGPYIDRELMKPPLEGALGKAIKQAVVETAKQVAPDLEEVGRMATAGRDKKGHFVPRETKTKAQEAYELLKLTRLAE